MGLGAGKTNRPGSRQGIVFRTRPSGDASTPSIHAIRRIRDLISGRDPTMRRLNEHQERLDQLRDRTAERLESAHRELKNLHWWNRGSRAELETHVARDRVALERTDGKRDQLRERVERRSRFLALARERDEVTPPLRPEPPRPRLEREPPGLGLEL